MSVFYSIARSYGKPGYTYMSVFYSIARTYGNLAIHMSMFYPSAGSYGNLVIHMSIFYPVAGSSYYELTSVDVLSALRRPKDFSTS